MGDRDARGVASCTGSHRLVEGSVHDVRGSITQMLGVGSHMMLGVGSHRFYSGGYGA